MGMSEELSAIREQVLEGIAKATNLEALEKGWSLSLAAEDPKSAKDRILEPVDGMRDASGKSEYQQLFEHLHRHAVSGRNAARAQVIFGEQAIFQCIAVLLNAISTVKASANGGVHLSLRLHLVQ